VDADVEILNRARDDLFRDFENFTRKVTLQLISELGIPADAKIVKQLHGAGIAGGIKFLVGNVFFKFAKADEKVYRNDDALAIKMAQNEVRHAAAVLKLKMHLLHLPLMACHRINGHAVIASATIPISREDSLMEGSYDGGQHVKQSNFQLCNLTRELASHFALQPHQINGHPSHLLLPLAADCEAHLSAQDGRY